MKLVVLEGGILTLSVLFNTDRMLVVIPFPKKPLSSSLILQRKTGSGGWDRTYDQSVIPGHKVSQSVIFIRV